MSETWTDWLGPEYSDYLASIRGKVTEICHQDDEQSRHLPFYTPHGTLHYQSVEDMIHKLIPGNKSSVFNERERFYLLASAWLHDLGMLLSVINDLYRSPLPTSEIRKIHHLASEKYVIEHWTKLGLRECDKWALSKLCRFHRRQEPIEHCEDRVLVGTDTVRLRVLAAYLRLADALDVGSSRAPTESYAVCLTYDIPIDLKLHWVKSMLISGIQPNDEERTITVSFIRPDPDEDSVQPDVDRIKQKIDSIVDLVVEDLRSELQSVLQVIIRHGPSTYLDIISSALVARLDKQKWNDLRELVVNYDILMDPSASKMLEMSMVSAANVLGYGLQKSGEAKRFPSSSADADPIKKLGGLLDFLERGAIAARPCHYGTKNIVERIRGLMARGCSVEELLHEIERAYREHYSSRSEIRKYSRLFLDEQFPDPQQDCELNILLYGYSELATIALCGFRDAFIVKAGVSDPRCVRDSPLEKEISNRINLFVCDGQPKTQTAIGDHLVYHDAIQYSAYLRRRKFTNIVLIPDVIAGNLIENLPIHYAIVGANGICDEFFKHSAGHSTIVNLVKEHQYKHSDYGPVTKVILIVSSEKYRHESIGEDSERSRYSVSDSVKSAREHSHLVEGHTFVTFKNMETRKSIWIPRDRTRLLELSQTKTLFYNPLEDNIQISKIDYVISDVGFFEMTQENQHLLISRLSEKQHNDQSV